MINEFQPIFCGSNFRPPILGARDSGAKVFRYSARYHSLRSGTDGEDVPPIGPIRVSTNFVSL